MQQQMSGDDIATNLVFLRAAGLLNAPLPQPKAVTSGNDTPADNNAANSGLTEAVMALAKDASEELDTFGRRLEALESQSAALEVPDSKVSLDNTSCTGGAKE